MRSVCRPNAYDQLVLVVVVASTLVEMLTLAGGHEHGQPLGDYHRCVNEMDCPRVFRPHAVCSHTDAAYSCLGLHRY